MPGYFSWEILTKSGSSEIKNPTLTKKTTQSGDLLTPLNQFGWSLQCTDFSQKFMELLIYAKIKVNQCIVSKQGPKSCSKLNIAV